MEAQAKTVGSQEQTEYQAEIRKLKEEEQSEQAQAEELVSQGNNLQREYARERENLVRQLETRLTAERESMQLQQGRLNLEATAYKAEIEHAVQKRRLMDEAEAKVAQAERKAEMLEKRTLSCETSCRV